MLSAVLVSTLIPAVRMRIGFSIVLVAVNLTALRILLMLDLIVFSRRQMTAVRRAIAARLLVNSGFILLDV